MVEGKLDEERDDYLAILSSQSPSDQQKMEAALGLMDVSRRDNDSVGVCKYLSMIDSIHLRTGIAYVDIFGTFMQFPETIDVKEIRQSEEFCGKRLMLSFWD